MSYSTTGPHIAPVTQDEKYWKKRAIEAEKELDRVKNTCWGCPTRVEGGGLCERCEDGL